MNVLIASGGTGGHLYPAVALAREFLDRDWETKILFLTTKKGCGVDVLSREEIKFKTIIAGGLKKKALFEMVLSILKLPVGFIQSLFYVFCFKPHIVIGTGAYISGPVLAAAWLARIPRMILEQNVRPGITNRMLSRVVDKIVVAFPESLKHFPESRTEVAGNPVRKEFFEIKPRLKEMEEPDPFTILVFGGSQGARSINQAMLKSAPSLIDSGKSFRILHQTGEADCQWVRSSYEEMGINAEAKPFIYDMFDAFRLADLIVSRSGAMTLSELTAAGKAALLIPLPSAADNHQEINARSLEKNNAAEVIIDNEFLADNLSAKLKYYMENPLALHVVGQEAKKLAQSDAVSRIAIIAENLVAKKREA